VGAHRKFVLSLASGLIAATGLLLAAEPAAAEWRVETTIDAPSPTRPRGTQRRPKAEPLPEEEENPEAAVMPERKDGDNPDEEDRDREKASEMPAPRPGTTDGDASSPEPPREPLDGIVVIGVPTAARDGIPDMSREAREPEDLAAFSLPAAPPYNPYLYSIELDPLHDRRTHELFNIDPYYALGVRVGGFVVFPEALIGMTATNNIFRNSARLGDQALEVGANVRAVSDWSRHAVEFRASGLATYYDKYPTEDDRSYLFEGRARIDITRRTNLELLALHQVDKDVRGLINSPVGATERGDVETDRFAFALNHRFNRLALQLRGSITDLEFSPVAGPGGTIITNAERNTTQREMAFRTSWWLNDSAAAFAEVGGNVRDYEVPPDDGILRSSTGERYRVGVTFGPQSNTLRGEVSVGWGRQAPRDARLSEIAGVIVDANLAWRATALTTLLLTARSDFIDTTTTGSAGALSRQVGLEARHSFRRYLIGLASIRYTVNPYDAVTISESDLTTELGLEYYFNRNAILFARYLHTNYTSTVPGSDYASDTIHVGLRVRQ
jgi:hypothetical protein